MNDNHYLQIALQEARRARDCGEVPIGALIVDQSGKIIGCAHNRRETDNDATAHAEILAIRQACQQLSAWRLVDCTIYVTLEPCLMCSGAIYNARLARVVYACHDKRFGALREIYSQQGQHTNHHLQINQGIAERESAELLTEFFANRRDKQKRLMR